MFFLGRFSKNSAEKALFTFGCLVYRKKEAIMTISNRATMYFSVMLFFSSIDGMERSDYVDVSESFEGKLLCDSLKPTRAHRRTKSLVTSSSVDLQCSLFSSQSENEVNFSDGYGCDSEDSFFRQVVTESQSSDDEVQISLRETKGPVGVVPLPKTSSFGLHQNTRISGQRKKGHLSQCGSMSILPTINVLPTNMVRSGSVYDFNTLANSRKIKYASSSFLRSEYQIAESENEENCASSVLAPKSKSLSIEDSSPIIPSMPIRTRFVLAIDGGGTRGIIPLTFVKAFQDTLRQRLDDEDLKISSIFDMFMGVSVGALVATTAAFDKIDVVDENFSDIAKNIFVKNWWWKRAVGAWYSSAGKENVFDELLDGTNYKEIKKLDEIGTRLMIPVYSYNTNEPIVFDSENPCISLFDALMGTSAASTYFKPHVCESIHGKVLQLIDPGMNKNSPALLAYKIMRSWYPNDRIAVISLGTGESSFVRKTSEYHDDLLRFACNFPSMVMGSATQWDDWIMRKVSETDDNLLYERFQIGLDEEDCLTDCTNEEHLISLKNEALRGINNPISNHYRHFQRVIKLIEDEIAQKKKFPELYKNELSK